MAAPPRLLVRQPTAGQTPLLPFALLQTPHDGAAHPRYVFTAALLRWPIALSKCLQSPPASFACLTGMLLRPLAHLALQEEPQPYVQPQGAAAESGWGAAAAVPPAAGPTAGSWASIAATRQEQQPTAAQAPAQWEQGAPTAAPAVLWPELTQEQPAAAAASDQQAGTEAPPALLEAAVVAPARPSFLAALAPAQADVAALALPGLRNEMGEFNCFLNVVLQCLWRCDAFRREVGGGGWAGGWAGGRVGGWAGGWADGCRLPGARLPFQGSGSLAPVPATFPLYPPLPRHDTARIAPDGPRRRRCRRRCR